EETSSQKTGCQACRQACCIGDSGNRCGTRCISPERSTGNTRQPVLTTGCNIEARSAKQAGLF
ncbi:hypothetical protein Pgy4_00610, partial [Pseudomonas savastanoi pv. glycinea str. race 4]